MQYLWWYGSWLLSFLFVRSAVIASVASNLARKLAREHPELHAIDSSPDEAVRTKHEGLLLRYDRHFVLCILLGLPAWVSWAAGMDAWFGIEQPYVTAAIVGAAIWLPATVCGHFLAGVSNRRAAAIIGLSATAVAAVGVGVYPLVAW